MQTRQMMLVDKDNALEGIKLPTIIGVSLFLAASVRGSNGMPFFSLKRDFKS